MRAMILAAGLGTRLRPLTAAKPKALVEVAGRPLIAWALDCVRKAGITEVVVNLHHFGATLRDYLGDGSRWGVRIAFSPEEVLLDSGGGILAARPLLGEGTFVTLNADTIVDMDLGRLLQAHLQKGATATLALRKDPLQERFGTIGLDEHRRIGRFLDHRRPDAPTALEDFMYTGVQVLEPRVFDYMEGTEPFSITRETYPRMLAAGEPLFGWPFDGTWVTVGTPEELEAATRRLGPLAHDAGGQGSSPTDNLS